METEAVQSSVDTKFQGWNWNQANSVLLNFCAACKDGCDQACDMGSVSPLQGTAISDQEGQSSCSWCLCATGHEAVWIGVVVVGNRAARQSEVLALQ